MIEIYLLEQLAAVAEHGTLLKASEALHLSQPALSRSMKKLEAQLGVQLFDRENSKISLNDTGAHAVDYAKRILALDREMAEGVAEYERRRRTVSLGSCAPFPLNAIQPTLQEQYFGMVLTSELAEDARLLTGLKNRVYQLAILHENPNDPELFVQRYLDEQLYVSFPREHPLAQRQSIRFSDLRGISILMVHSVGFWMEVCKRHLEPGNLLIQNSFEALGELIDASRLPFFNSDRMLERAPQQPDRISVPISDADARTVYYIACLASEKQKYNAVFSAARQAVLNRA